MPFNGSGVFQRVRNWVNDATAGIKIRADFHDAEDDNLAAGLTNCIAKDGQTLITQNIPFNSKRITGLADPSGAQDAATKAYADTKEASSSTRLIPPGAIMDFGTPTAPAGWVVCDGQTVTIGAVGSTYYALFQAIGYSWGGSGPSFMLPPLQNRFRRHRDAAGEAGIVGTLKASLNIAHGHAISGAPTFTTSSDGGHQHDVFLHDPGHTHTIAMQIAVNGYQLSGQGPPAIAGTVTSSNNTTGITPQTAASIGGVAQGTANKTASVAAHSHSLSTWAIGTLKADDNVGTETRPLSAAVLTCIKL